MMDSIGFVYKWCDSSNGKYYIGSHCGDVNDGYVGSGSYFKKAYKKRKECFSREILYLGKDYAELEEFILNELDAMNDAKSYNLTNNARGVSAHSEVVRKRISNSLKGRFFSEETRRKLSEKKRGKLHPAYGTNGYVKGMKHTEESKLKMSKANSRAIFCELNNKKYQSVKDASFDLGVSISHINNMISGRKINKYKLKAI